LNTATGLSWETRGIRDYPSIIGDSEVEYCNREIPREVWVMVRVGMMYFFFNLRRQSAMTGYGCGFNGESTTVSGVIIVNAKATVRDNFRSADQSIPLYLKIALTIFTPAR